ncbi:hypothetical protein LTR96_011723, partial [Exophiala xenobiotica]
QKPENRENILATHVNVGTRGVTGYPRPSCRGQPLLQSQQPTLDRDSCKTCCYSHTWTALPQGKGTIFHNLVHDQEKLLIQQHKDRLDTYREENLALGEILVVEGIPFDPKQAAHYRPLLGGVFWT